MLATKAVKSEVPKPLQFYTEMCCINQKFRTIIIKDALNLVTKGLEGERSRKWIISNKLLV